MSYHGDIKIAALPVSHFLDKLPINSINSINTITINSMTGVHSIQDLICHVKIGYTSVFGWIAGSDYQVVWLWHPNSTK